jgi:dienelactone hydrolase
VTDSKFGQVGRIEVHPIPTVTLSDHQFLEGSHEGIPALIAGELRLPTGSGAFPAVILIHGSGGIGGNVGRWATEFVKMGVAAFIVDCFTGRGIASTIPDQSLLGGLAMIYDAYRALELLGRHTSVDCSRVGLMGFSKGGFAALYASMRRFQAFYAPAGVEFAAYIPFYARCDIRFDRDEDISDKPIRMFHGEDDDWVPVGPAREYAARLQAAGRDVTLTTYPGARHAFDSTTYPPAFTFTDAEITTRCRLVEKGGQIINLETGKPFTHQDGCVTRGATVGSNSAAYERARAEVAEFLKQIFRLSSI